MTKKIECEKCGIVIDADYDTFHEIEGSHFTYNYGECNISGELPMRYDFQTLGNNRIIEHEGYYVIQ